MSSGLWGVLLGSLGLLAGPSQSAHWIGRWEMSDPAGPRATWSGSALETRFEGTEASIRLSAPNGSSNYMVVVDGEAPRRFVARAGASDYLLARGLPSGIHTVRLSTENEGQNGVTQVLGFDFGQGRVLDPPASPSRRLEVIGDSITCGYGNLGAQAFANAGNHWNPKTCDPSNDNESHYMAYGAVLARMLRAELTTVCYSGRGVYEDYGSNTDSPEHPQMPAYYLDTLTAGLDNQGHSYNGVGLHQYPYDPTSALPASSVPTQDWVLINLGTNDISGATHAHGNSGHLPEEGAWRTAYQKLINEVRSFHPRAEIFLTLGPMVSEPLLSGYRAYLDRLVTELRSVSGEDRVHALVADHQDSSAGIGCSWHPTSLPIRLSGEVWQGGENEHFAAELASQMRRWVSIPDALSRDPLPYQAP